MTKIGVGNGNGGEAYSLGRSVAQSALLSGGIGRADLEPPAAAKKPPCAPRPGADRQGLVLVMDDEEMVRSIAGRMVQACGFDVECASDGAEAIVKLEGARRSGRPFDVVILDLTVKGGMGGEEAIRKIREMDAGIKTVVSSGYSDNPVVSHYRAYGFDACLNKPYTVTALKESLAALLNGAPAEPES